MEANSWVFHYAPPHTAHPKATVNKDLDAAHKNNKLPSKAEGAKEGDLMGIVGKKVPRQESNTTGVAAAAATSKTTNPVSAAKNDQRGTMHWAAEESALKRQKAATGSTTATPPPRNPWADSPAPSSVSVHASQTTQNASSHPRAEEAVARKEEAKKISEKSEFKIHSAKFTDEEEEEEEDREVLHRETAMDVVVEQKDAPPPAPPSALTASATTVVPPGGIKFSSKLKQKLGVSAAVPVSTPTTSNLYAVAEPKSLSAAAVKAEDNIFTTSVVNVAQDDHEDVADELQQKEIPQLPAHALPPTSPVLPYNASDRPNDTSPPAASHHSTHLARMSTEDDQNIALVSQDFSAIDDFVKNYTTQQGPLQGYASFARVDSEIATQLHSKRTSATPNEEAHNKNEGIAASSDRNDDPFAQIKQHERTPSRVKKFADVALSPMPAIVAATPVAVVVQQASEQRDMPQYEQHIEHEPMSGIAEGNDNEEADHDDRDSDAEKEENEEMQVDSVSRSRPPTSHAESSRHTTANISFTDAAVLSRPSTGTGTIHASLPTPPSIAFNTSRPPTAPEVSQVSGSLSSPLRQATPHGARSGSRPSTGAARLSSSAAEAALLSPFSDAIAYFEQSKKSRDFSSSLRGSGVLGSETENRQNAEPNVSSSMHIDETQSYFDVYQQRSSGIAQQWAEDVDGLLDRLSHPSLTSSHTSSSRPTTGSAATAAAASASAENASFTSLLTPSSLTTPLPERKKRAIRSRVASLLRQVEQAEMEYIAEFGFEAFEQEVGFFEEKTRGKWA